MTIVVITPRTKAAESICKQLLPRPAVVITSPLRCYSFFHVAHGTPEHFAFRDPIDGELLTEYRSFPDVEAVHAWVSADAAQHAHMGRPS